MINTLSRWVNLSLFILLSFSILFSSGCLKEMNNTGYNPNGNLPLLITTEVSSVTQTTALSGGTVILEGGSAVVARGVCWNTSPVPTIADQKTIDSSGPGNFTSYITGLFPKTKYYVRAYATDSIGTSYGSTYSFTTLQGGAGFVIDIDGNEYHSVSIGNQVWLVENLKVSHFRNGEAIPNITGNSSWANLKIAAYCGYLNDTTIAGAYGYLYNWYAVNDGRNIAPTGWHIAADSEWQSLFTYLGGVDSAGGKMKEAGFIHWISPNTGASNSSGFSALPAGFRLLNGTFTELQSSAFFWVASQTSGYYGLNKQSKSVSYSECSKSFGLSVRCVKD